MLPRHLLCQAYPQFHHLHRCMDLRATLPSLFPAHSGRTCLSSRARACPATLPPLGAAIRPAQNYAQVLSHLFKKTHLPWTMEEKNLTMKTCPDPKSGAVLPILEPTTRELKKSSSWSQILSYRASVLVARFRCESLSILNSPCFTSVFMSARSVWRTVTSI